jgi:hypothetical protein
VALWLVGADAAGAEGAARAAVRLTTLLNPVAPFPFHCPLGMSQRGQRSRAMVHRPFANVVPAVAPNLGKRRANTAEVRSPGEGRFGQMQRSFTLALTSFTVGYPGGDYSSSIGW